MRRRKILAARAMWCNGWASLGKWYGDEKSWLLELSAGWAGASKSRRVYARLGKSRQVTLVLQSYHARPLDKSADYGKSSPSDERFMSPERYTRRQQFEETMASGCI